MCVLRVLFEKWIVSHNLIFFRTDNAIKNHWNSSLKKKLEFYLATGNLPPDTKMGLQNSAKEINKTSSTGKLQASKRLDSTAQNSPPTTEECKVEEDFKDQSDPSIPSRDTGPSTSIPPSEPADSEGVKCNSQSSNLETIIPKFEDKVIAKSSQFDGPTYGSLYYEPPLLERCVTLDSNNLNMSWVHQESGFSPISSSPISFFTPPRVKSRNLYDQTPESILKIAAMSFPNTPSILRKRKNEAQSFLSRNKIGKEDGEAAEEKNRGSDNQGQSKSDDLEKSEPHDGHLEYKSLCLDTGGTALCNGKAFNASPPYRLRSKRTSVLKSVEKQLEFTFDEENSTVTRDCSIASKMGVT